MDQISTDSKMLEEEEESGSLKVSSLGCRGEAKDLKSHRHHKRTALHHKKSRNENQHLVRDGGGHRLLHSSATIGNGYGNEDRSRNHQKRQMKAYNSHEHHHHHQHRRLGARAGPRSRSLDGRPCFWSSNASSEATQSPPRKSIFGAGYTYFEGEDWSDFQPRPTASARDQHHHRNRATFHASYSRRHPYYHSFNLSNECLTDEDHAMPSSYGCWPDVPQRNLPFLNNDDQFPSQMFRPHEEVVAKEEEENDKSVEHSDKVDEQTATDPPEEEKELTFLEKVQVKMAEAGEAIKESAEETKKSFEKSLEKTREEHEQRMQNMPKLDLTRPTTDKVDEQTATDTPKEEKELTFLEKVQVKMAEAGDAIKESAEETKSSFEKSLEKTRIDHELRMQNMPKLDLEMPKMPELDLKMPKLDLKMPELDLKLPKFG
ncbi:hypothetical protein Ciccas_000011 [Cichlidogyrus casuarinus]|uniref:Uncharacterized protein n=1 Tax=Cichlidogyrus casuarinus TaxID=1844966 RepID=A0ABD2QP86_9PLAT